MGYTSNAEWTKTGKSQDTHETKKAAAGVCFRLLEDYSEELGSPCEIRGYCIRAWVEEEKQKQQEAR